ncbi:prepilin-type N-terminal cleavage/methylation domain-containing protein [Colwellia sp. E2M01]|uniref:PulJ/GspJ family protein n=1 Tax=Colwellia sp. E2M01 TaxID=2841561 RepID=UPI001C089986|nr:prepilin-type N-terminal cleavage/methylation domain-containing protein [Colwellia sp. E2M01]MBU2869357.1 prepilin-type N-terminal cleavage/methylation domain-containing protein [Colwellia sp. E2M01]
MKLLYSPLKTFKHQQGFSLLEALIASTIFAAVLLIASSAFKFFMSMSSRSVNSEQVMQETMNSIQLRNAIKGLHHYYLRENAISLKDAKPFFRGNEEGFTGITLDGINFVNQPVRITLSILNNDNNISNLVYCEYSNKLTFPTADITAKCDQPKVLAANVTDVAFDYFGWSSRDALYNLSGTIGNTGTSRKGWLKLWRGELQGLLPQYIRVVIRYNNEINNTKPYQPTQLWFQITDADPVQFNVNGSSSNEF